MIVRGGLGAFGDLVDDYPRLYEKFRDARARMAATVLAPLSRRIPKPLYASIMRKQADNAAANLREIEGISFITSGQRAELAEIARKLADYAAGAAPEAAKDPKGTVTPLGSKYWVERYQNWLTRLTGQTIAEHDSTVGAANRAPAKVKKAVKKAAETALEVPRDILQKGLGIPKWFVPVALVVVGAAFLFPYVAPGIIRSVKGGGS